MIHGNWNGGQVTLVWMVLEVVSSNSSTEVWSGILSRLQCCMVVSTAAVTAAVYVFSACIFPLLFRRLLFAHLTLYLCPLPPCVNACHHPTSSKPTVCLPCLSRLLVSGHHPRTAFLLVPRSRLRRIVAIVAVDSTTTGAIQLYFFVEFNDPDKTLSTTLSKISCQDFFLRRFSSSNLGHKEDFCAPNAAI